MAKRVTTVFSGWWDSRQLLFCKFVFSLSEFPVMSISQYQTSPQPNTWCVFSAGVWADFCCSGAISCMPSPPHLVIPQAMADALGTRSPKDPGAASRGTRPVSSERDSDPPLCPTPCRQGSRQRRCSAPEELAVTTPHRDLGLLMSFLETL